MDTIVGMCNEPKEGCGRLSGSRPSSYLILQGFCRRGLGWRSSRRVCADIGCAGMIVNGIVSSWQLCAEGLPN